MSVNWGALNADNNSAGAQASALSAKMQKARDISRPGEQTVAGQLPARLIRHDEQTFRELKEAPELADYFGYDKIAPPVEKMTEWLKKKREDEEFVNFEKWVLETWDVDAGPERKAWIRQMFPDIADRRASFAYAKLDLQRALIDIHIYGPRAREDFELLYAIMKGDFLLSEVLRPAWEAPNKENDTIPNYIQGLFSTDKAMSTGKEFTDEAALRKAFFRGIQGFNEDLWAENLRQGNAFSTTALSATGGGLNEAFTKLGLNDAFTASTASATAAKGKEERFK